MAPASSRRFGKQRTIPPGFSAETSLPIYQSSNRPNSSWCLISRPQRPSVWTCRNRSLPALTRSSSSHPIQASRLTIPEAKSLTVFVVQHLGCRRTYPPVALLPTFIRSVLLRLRRRWHIISHYDKFFEV